MLEDQNKEDDRSSTASSCEFRDSVSDEVCLPVKNVITKIKISLTIFVISRNIFAARNMASTVNLRNVQQLPPRPPVLLQKTTATTEKCYQYPTLFTISANLHYIAYRARMRVFFMTLELL